MALYTYTIASDEAPTNAELPDDDAAWAEAIRLSGEILRDLDGDLPADTDWRLSVTGAQGRPIATVVLIAKRHRLS